VSDEVPEGPVPAQRRLIARLKYVEPSQLVAAIVIVLILAAAIVAVSIIGWPLGTDPFADLPDDPSIVVGLVGSFPAEGEEPLAEPTGIAIDGSCVYIAEAGAGRVAIFNEKGERTGEVALDVADGQAKAVPTSVAAAGSERFAVIDARGGRVLVFQTAADSAALLFRVGAQDDDTAPERPTAVAYHDGEIYVADAAVGAIHVYDGEGAFVRTLGADVEPPLGHVGGIAVSDERIVVAESDRNQVRALDPDSGVEIGVFADAYSLPRGVVAVRDGVAVAEVLGAAVRVCDAEGARTHSIAADTVSADAPFAPEGVAWHERSGRLYVTDPDVGRVKVYGVRF